MKINRLFTVIILTGIIFGQYNPDNHVVTTSMYYMNSVEDGSWDEFFELAEEEFTKMNRELVTSRVKRNNKSTTENNVVTVVEWYLKPMSKVEGGTVEEREALFDEYHKKVIMRNNKILSRREMRHYWTGSLGGGTTPYVIVTEFANIVDADAVGINNETIQKSWPDEEKRKAFFEKRNKYIDREHNLGHRDIALHTNWVKLAKR